MVGDWARVGPWLLALSVAGCGSSAGSAAAGGSGTGGATQDASAGSVAEGGVASGPANGGAAGGATLGAGAPSANAGSAGAAGAGAHSGGTGSGGAASGGTGGGGTGGGGTGSGGTGSGGTGSGGGSAGASGFAGLPACTLEDDASAPFVGFERTSDPAPVPSGGPIAGGTYFLTKLTYHGGTHVDGSTCLPLLVREVLRFAATSSALGTLHSTLSFTYTDGSGASTSATESKYQAQGSSLSLQATCSVSGDYSQPYTATSTQFLTISSTFDPPCDKGVVLVSTYAKQP